MWGEILTLLLTVVTKHHKTNNEKKIYVGRNTDIATYRNRQAPICFLMKIVREGKRLHLPLTTYRSHQAPQN